MMSSNSGLFGGLLYSWSFAPPSPFPSWLPLSYIGCHCHVDHYRIYFTISQSYYDIPVYISPMHKVRHTPCWRSEEHLSFKLSLYASINSLKLQYLSRVTDRIINAKQTTNNLIVILPYGWVDTESSPVRVSDKFKRCFHFGRQQLTTFRDFGLQSCLGRRIEMRRYLGKAVYLWPWLAIYLACPI